MLRIHFDWRDLQGVRVAQQPDPLWELMCATCRWQTRQGPLEFGHWHREVRQRLPRDVRAAHALRVLSAYVPTSGYIPDFLTPPVTGEGLDSSLDAVRATPRERVRGELARLVGSRTASAEVRGTTDPTGLSLGPLTDVMRRSFRTLLEPYWDHVRAAVSDDVSLRTRTLLEGGTGALLDGLRPFARWKPPYLEVDYPADRELRLEGRGLVLVPSYFCWRRPTALADPGLDPVLVYPVVKQQIEILRTGEERLDRLLGRTRTAVLLDVANRRARTTTEVADALRLALATASYQIGVLRGAGLIVSHRDGKHVEHSVTPLAHALLAGTGAAGRV